MITNTFMPHSMLKKRQSASNYHCAREAVAVSIVSMVFCPTKYNLVGMGTKALNGMIQQFLLKTQTFSPPAERVGECKAKSSESASGKTTWQTNYTQC
eukprot:407596-Ditylum_brightwellii.AAC.1